MLWTVGLESTSSEICCNMCDAIKGIVWRLRKCIERLKHEGQEAYHLDVWGSVVWLCQRLKQIKIHKLADGGLWKQHPWGVSVASLLKTGETELRPIDLLGMQELQVLEHKHILAVEGIYTNIGGLDTQKALNYSLTTAEDGQYLQLLHILLVQ